MKVFGVHLRWSLSEVTIIAYLGWPLIKCGVHVHLFTSVTTHYLGQLYEFFIKDWHFDAYLLDFLIFFLDMHKNCYLYNWFDIYMQGTLLWKQSPYQTLNISWNMPNALAAFKIQTLSFQRRPQINMKKISLLQIRYPFF